MKVTFSFLIHTDVKCYLPFFLPETNVKTFLQYFEFWMRDTLLTLVLHTHTTEKHAEHTEDTDLDKEQCSLLARAKY